MEATAASARRLRLFAQAAGIVLTLLGAAAMLGWLAPWESLTRLGLETAPVSPATGLAFMILGPCLACVAAARPGGPVPWLVGLGALIVAGAGALILVEHAAGIDLAVSRLLDPPRGMGDASESRVSVLTAASLVLAALTFFLIPFPVREGGGDGFAGLVGFVVAAAGLVFVMAFLYAAPVHSIGLPVPLLTSAGFVVLGFGLICAAGPGDVMVRPFLGSSVRARMLRAFLPSTVILIWAVAWITHVVTSNAGPTSGAVFSAGLAVSSAVIIALISARLARRIGRRLEHVERELRQVQSELENKVIARTSELHEAKSMLETKTQRLESLSTELRESEAFYHALVETLPQNILRKDLHGRFTFGNKLFLKTMGKRLEEIIGKTDFDFFPRELAEKYRRDDQEVMRSGTTLNVVESHVTPAGEKLYVQVVKTPIRGPNNDVIGIQGIFWDVTEQKRAEQRLELQHSVSRALAEAATIKEATSAILQIICENLGWQYGAVWQRDREHDVLRCDSIWYPQAMNFMAFAAMSRQISFHRGVGLPGRVWESGQPTWLADVVSDTNFPRAPRAAQVGLHAAIGFPILLGGDVLGVVEFFSKTILQPDPDLLSMLGAIGSQIGQFIERRRAEEALRESEERFALAIRGANDGLWDYDIINRRTYMSPRWKEMLGYGDEEIPNRTGEWERLLHPDDRDRALGTMQAYLEGKLDHYELEHRLQHKDGSYRWILTRGVALRDLEGRPYRMAGSHTDITERKLAEEALSKSELLFRQVWENTEDGMRLTDENGVVRMVNPAYCRMVDKTREELEGRPFAIVHEAGRQEHILRRHRERFDNREVAGQFEREIVLWNGKKVWFEVTTSFLELSGQAPLLLSIFRDITKRKRAEEALARERYLLTTLLDTVPDSIYFKDENCRFIRINKALTSRFGAGDPSEVVGKSDFDYFSPEHASQAYEDERELMRTGRPLIDKEEKETWPDGRVTWVSTTKMALQKNGQVIGTFGISRDITDRKRTEEMLRKTAADLARSNEELQRSHRDLERALTDLKSTQSQLVQSEKLASLGQLVAGVAHEINNPLSFVSNNAAVMQRDFKALCELLERYREGEAALAEKLPALFHRIRELSERIDVAYTIANLEEMQVRSRDGLKRIQQIVRDLRDFARLDESDLHEVDINAGVESTVNIIRGRAKKHQVELRLELAPLPPVMCFPAKVNQVIMNLVANAIDASPENSQVLIQTRRLAEGIEIHVIDHGKGVDPKVRDKIFDPFITTKPVGQGTGLGLSISYGIVRDHGGRIGFESEPGRGTHFTVYLPLKPPVRGTPPS